MKRLITFALVFTVICCTSCKEKPDDGEKGKESESPQKYVVGSYYNVNGVQGIVYKVNADGSHGMIVSMDETEISWAKDATIGTIQTNALDYEDGVKNMEKIKEKGIENYPAFKWCNDKNTGGKSDWYLPALNDMVLISSIRGQLQNALSTNGGTILTERGVYWSSTEYFDLTGTNGPNFSYSVQFNSMNYQGVEAKTYVRKVRAVRAF